MKWKIESLSLDRNDCTVRALSNASGISYVSAYSIMKQAGREDGHGANMESGLLRFVWVTSRRYHSVPVPAKYTLAQFAEDHPEGKYIIRLANRPHVLAVVNGVAFDNYRPQPRMEISAVWRITETKGEK